MCFYGSDRIDPSQSRLKKSECAYTKGHQGLTVVTVLQHNQSIPFSCHDVALGPSQDDRFINTQTAGRCAVIKN